MMIAFQVESEEEEAAVGAAVNHSYIFHQSCTFLVHIEEHLSCALVASQFYYIEKCNLNGVKA